MLPIVFNETHKENEKEDEKSTTQIFWFIRSSIGTITNHLTSSRRQRHATNRNAEQNLQTHFGCYIAVDCRHYLGFFQWINQGNFQVLSNRNDPSWLFLITAQFFAWLQFLYQNENFDKPFFCTYFKTSMFTLYLLVLGMIAPWKETCERAGNSSYTVSERPFQARWVAGKSLWVLFLSLSLSLDRFQLVDQNAEDENFFSNHNTLVSVPLRVINTWASFQLNFSITFPEWLNIRSNQKRTNIGHWKWWFKHTQRTIQ